MPINKNLLRKYLDDHKSHYIGKYKYRCAFQVKDTSYKCNYYMMDENFRFINIYIDLYCGDEVTYTFSENLNDQEKIYIVKDAITRILYRENYQSLLHYSLYENFINNVVSEEMKMAPVDYVCIFNYMKYHKGINQKTIDQFYELFIPSLESLESNGRYTSYLESVILLFKNILYENEWDGPNSKYLDTEYQYHLYYIRKIVRNVYENLDKFYDHAQETLMKVIEVLCQHARFTFSIMTDFGSLVLSHVKVTNAIFKELKSRFELDDRDIQTKNPNLVFSYLYYIYKNDYKRYRFVVENVFRQIINNMLTFANHDLDLALGLALLQNDGYQILLDVFHQDYNTFIFTCFPIESFPDELKPKVRKELVGAIQFFAGRMENDKYKLSSFEQVTNINRLLLDNFKEWYK